MHCLSQVFLIHYKRFEIVKQNGQFFNIKIQDPIAANSDLFICGQKYDLVGVLVHQGESANSGHYFFDTVCPPYLTTRLAYRSNNDDRPGTISMETLIEDVNNAYMLAYQKAADPPQEQPAAACVPPPPERMPSRKKVEDPQKQSVSAARVPSSPPAAPQQKEVHPSAAASVPSTPKVKNQEKAKEGATNTSDTVVQDEDYFKDLLQERDAILSIPKAARSTAEISRNKRVNEQIRKLKDRYPHIRVKQPAKTSAEKVASYRQNEMNREKERLKDRARMAVPKAKEKDRARKATDENREKDRARKASDENKEKDRARKASDENKAKTAARMATNENKMKNAARMATDENKAADLQRKTAKKANVKVKARDGLKSDLILSGKFGVQTNSLGAMDKVNPIKQSQLKHTSLVTQCIN